MDEALAPESSQSEHSEAKLGNTSRFNVGLQKRLSKSRTIDKEGVGETAPMTQPNQNTFGDPRGSKHRSTQKSIAFENQTGSERMKFALNRTNLNSSNQMIPNSSGNFEPAYALPTQDEEIHNLLARVNMNHTFVTMAAGD